MTVLTFVTNDRFVIRIIKSHVNNPSKPWSNTYEVLANSSGALNDLTGLVEALVLFEKTLHLGIVEFIRATVSTWAEDSVPYNPSNFAVYDQTGVGTWGGSAPHAPLTTALSVVRQPTSGRQGHIFYRGVLSQGDIVAPSGISILEDPTAWQGNIDDAVTAAELGGYIGQDAEGPLILAMVNKAGTNTRPVMGLAAGGVVQLPVDHAWFNRTTTP